MPRPTTVDRMTEQEARSLLKQIVADARAGVRHGSSADVGDMVIEHVRRAGIRIRDEGIITPVLKETRR